DHEPPDPARPRPGHDRAVRALGRARGAGRPRALDHAAPAGAAGAGAALPGHAHPGRRRWILLGMLAATRPGSPIDGLSRVVAMVGISMPAFWVGLLLIIGFSMKLGWLPSTGMYSPAGDGGA